MGGHQEQDKPYENITWHNLEQVFKSAVYSVWKYLAKFTLWWTKGERLVFVEMRVSADSGTGSKCMSKSFRRSIERVSVSVI